MLRKFQWIVVIITLLSVLLGLWGGTSSNRPYEERNYMLILATMSMIIMFTLLNILMKNKTDKSKDNKEEK